MAVVMLNDPRLEMTGDPAKLRRAIDAYNVRATGVLRTDELGAHVLTTIGAIGAVARSKPAKGRKTIVGIGSGWLFDRPIPPPRSGNDLLPEWIAAMRALSRTNTTFYAIDPAGVGITRADGGDTGFARETGGHRVPQHQRSEGRRRSDPARVGQLLRARASAVRRSGGSWPARAGTARLAPRRDRPRAPRDSLAQRAVLARSRRPEN